MVFIAQPSCFFILISRTIEPNRANLDLGDSLGKDIQIYTTTS